MTINLCCFETSDVNYYSTYHFSKMTRIKTMSNPNFFFCSGININLFFVSNRVFLGYSKPQASIANALIFQSGEMIIVRHVILNESMFPFERYIFITNALIFKLGLHLPGHVLLQLVYLVSTSHMMVSIFSIFS